MMNKNEKAARQSGSNTELTSELNNMNYNPNKLKFQPPSHRETLLSKLPRLPERRPPSFDNTPSAVAVRAVCAGCGLRLDSDDPMQLTFGSCRKCLGIYSRVGTAVEATARRKIQESLEKMGGFSR
jgi:hypothetical protein